MYKRQVLNSLSGETSIEKIYMDFTPIITSRLSQLSLLCDWLVKHAAIEYINPWIQLTVTSKHHWFSQELARDDKFNRKLVVWDVHRAWTDDYAWVGINVVDFVL